MQLSIRLLDDVGSVNRLQAVTELNLSGSPGPLDIYFQFIDRQADPSDAACRYVPNTGATTRLMFRHANDAKVMDKVASQPFAGDGSIWKVSLLAIESALLSGTVNLSFQLTEGTSVRSGQAFAALRVL